MAELQAIARVLLSLPLPFSISIVTDSLSSINSISAFMNEYSDRARLRMCGRPLLSIIAQQIVLRLHVGASVSFSHVRSHTNLPTCESRGNAVADYFADELREHQWKYVNTMPQFDLRMGERHVNICDHTFNCVVSGDIRACASEHTKMLVLWEWMKSESQGAFAHEGVRDLCKYVFTSSSVQRYHRALFVLLITNLLHKERVSVGSSHSSSALSHVSSSSSSSSLSSLSLSLSSNDPAFCLKANRRYFFSNSEFYMQTQRHSYQKDMVPYHPKQ